FRADTDRTDIRDPYWRSVGTGADRRRGEIGGGVDVTLDAQHVLGLGEFHHAAADFIVGALDRLLDPVERYVVGAKLLRVDGDLVLLDETADAGDLGNAFDRRQFVLEIPVLQAAQFLQVAFGTGQRVHEGPTHARRVGPE